MAIRIAGKQFPTRRPQNLDAELIKGTGCNAAENLRIVSGVPLPGRIASALAPFLQDDAPPLAELAALIEADLATATTTVVSDVKRLLAPSDAPSSEKEA